MRVWVHLAYPLETARPEGSGIWCRGGVLWVQMGGRLKRMPNQPRTTARNIRIPDELWADMKFIAAAEGYEGGVSAMTREDYEGRREVFERAHGPIDRESAAYRAAQK